MSLSYLCISPYHCLSFTLTIFLSVSTGCCGSSLRAKRRLKWHRFVLFEKGADTPLMRVDDKVSEPIFELLISEDDLISEVKKRVAAKLKEVFTKKNSACCC
jgi:hypothetical protein